MFSDIAAKSPSKRVTIVLLHFRPYFPEFEERVTPLLNQAIVISIAHQQLQLFNQGQLIKTYSVSTALKGSGNRKGSNQTPLGRHYVRAKIGAGQPVNSVFLGRRPTGELYSSELAQRFPERDWILARILWLCGCQIGYNRLGEVDTMQRFIYIHGTPDSEPMGVPLSHGCIRMRNSDIIELFERVACGTTVEILA